MIEILDCSYINALLSNQIEKVNYYKRDNFYAVIINDTYVGFAKRNPVDEDNEEIGESLALMRALTDMALELEEDES